MSVEGGHHIITVLSFKLKALTGFEKIHFKRKIGKILSRTTAIIYKKGVIYLDCLHHSEDSCKVNTGIANKDITYKVVARKT